jgi:hypothetical protein
VLILNAAKIRALSLDESENLHFDLVNGENCSGFHKLLWCGIWGSPTSLEVMWKRLFQEGRFGVILVEDPTMAAI